MGDLRGALPIAYWTFLIGALAAVGFPGLAGFFSRSDILFRAFASGHTVLWGLGMLGSLLTSICMFRLTFMTFHGDARRAHHDVDSSHPQDIPLSMAVPLVLLAAGSIAAGYVGIPDGLGGGNRIQEFLAPSFTVVQQSGLAEIAEGTRAVDSGLALVLMLLSTSMSLAGIAIAARIYLQQPEIAERVTARFPGLSRFLVNKGYVDELYDEAVVQPVLSLSENTLWRRLDATAIDGAVNGMGTIVSGIGLLLRELQTGSVRSYALSVLLGAVLIVGYYLWR
jgi:NADH-quinone oxidoreductase subunit L